MEQIVHLGATYGSVGAVVILLIWLSWNVNAIFYGGALATELELAWKNDPQDTTVALEPSDSDRVISLAERRQSRP